MFIILPVSQVLMKDEKTAKEAEKLKYLFSRAKRDEAFLVFGEW